MKIQMKFPFVGGRIVKTGIAVIITAFICHILNWPAMFAVITAIVTIEPTTGNSVRKAFVRFPASAIGAAFSVLFTFLFGDSPYSYAFVSLFTIIACHKLKLHDGTLVATLTGVAMISTVHEHYLSSFFIRLGTTSTGLIVSSFVNYLVMPPRYSEIISTKIHSHFEVAGDILYKRGLELSHIQGCHKEIRQQYQNLISEMDKTETLCGYQKDEWKYHRFNRKDVREFHYEYKKLDILRQITYHLGNLIYLPSQYVEMDQGKNEQIMSTIQSIKNIFNDEKFSISDEHLENMTKITERFTHSRQNHSSINQKQHHFLLPETAILYELLSIHDLTVELSQLHNLEFQHHQLLEGR
ncbi:aromatic acid exporter family protein [Neobacillus sp. D3-1R]|uniref:aromatic acid exporter family protein n=1 Tax=Neobacillus sp. D3-1R TaxID=3445778 RepID=UPI003FA1447D